MALGLAAVTRAATQLGDVLRCLSSMALGLPLFFLSLLVYQVRAGA